MACLLITYDLNTPGQDYKALHEVIKTLGTSWWHHLDSTWLVAATLTPSQAWDKIATVADKNDNFLIVNITGDATQGWLPKDAWEWIRANV
jgi:hypothetical protein